MWQVCASESPEKVINTVIYLAGVPTAISHCCVVTHALKLVVLLTR